jgi:hypothetical protein
LGFITRSGAHRQLTARGKMFVAASRWQRFQILFQAVAATPVFREYIRRNLERRPVDATEIAEMIFAKGYANKTTSGRRAKTVVAWMDWLWHEHANLKE